MENMKLKTGDIVFSAPKNILFRLIQYWTRDKWTHVAIVLAVIDNHVLIAEALPSGIDINDLIWYDVEKRDFIVYRLNSLSTNGLRGSLTVPILEFIGKGYDFLALANFLIGKPVLGKKKKHYCSRAS